MGISAVEISNYVITQENVNPEVGTLIINAAYFPPGDTAQTSVVLETLPQNEVTYRLQTSGIKDADGNSIPGIISTLGGIVNTGSVTFAGSAPTLIDLVVTADTTGAITGWVDVNGNSLLDAGDTLKNNSGNNIILTDFDGDGVIDNWVDTDTSVTVTDGDVISGFQDTDGDGISDSQELYGESIFIEKANGEVVVVSVTSNPLKADTDGDGLNDLEELNIGTNPRNTDTDGDSIPDYVEWNVVYSDTNAQDSDLDGLIDGVEHNFYKTSPLLADSDGDQLSDSVELLELNRDPRIADLPNLKITVGDVRLQIDERYSYTDESGQTVTQESSSNTTLANSQNDSFSNANSHTLEFTGSASVRGGASVGGFFGGGSDGYSAGVELTASAGFSDSNTQQTESVSAKESQQVYENSLSKGREFSTTSTVSREVFGASIDIDLTITNAGNIPFTVSNIEVTVLQQVGNQERFLPVATLVSNSELITGTPLQVNLGAFTSERGPFLFTSREVFPNLVEAIMRNPSGLVFRVANYDVADELGRNYAFSNQVARDRTASITMDYGDAAAAKNYLVATNGAQDDQNIAGGGYLGGFNATNGRSLGLPISYVLQNIMQIPRQDTTLDKIVAGTNDALESAGANLKGDDTLQNINGNDVITAGANGWLETRPIGDDFVANPAVANSIVAGLNKTADSTAAGDDIQLVPLDTKGLSIGTIVIDPGANGVLESLNQVDDKVDFALGYETSRSCSALSNKASDICRIDTDCECQLNDTDTRCKKDPVPTVLGSCSGPERLVRVNSLRNGDFNRGWVILTSGNLPAAADFDQIIVNPGTDLSLNFLQDLDKDGIFARNEFLFGSTDSSSDVYTNNDFGESFNQDLAPDCPHPCDGKADSRDTDRDGLDDYAEIFVGWKVAADGGALKQVFSSPRFSDTDGDGLLDPVEQDLRRYCVDNDYRKDALCAFQSTAPVLLADAIVIIAGSDGIANTKADTSDEQLIAVGIKAVYGSPVVGPGTDGILTTALVDDDLYESQSSIPPATDPSSSDTDLDEISDFNELNGFSAGLAVIDGGNGIAETLRNGDDLQRAFIDNPVFPGGVIILPGQNSIIDSIAPSTESESLALINAYELEVATIIQNASAQDAVILQKISDLTVNGGDDTYEERTTLTGVRGYVLCGADLVASTTESTGLTYILPGTLCTSPTQIIIGGILDPALFNLGALNNAVDAAIVQLESTLNATIVLPKIDWVDDDYVRLATDGLVSDPLRRDTDNDLFADGFELLIGANPTKADDSDFIDSDQDGLSDREENSLGWMVSVDGGISFTVKSSPSLPDTDFDGLPDFVERDLRTNPNNPDTDGDGISDYDEINDLSKYATIAALYPNLNIVATTTSGYGTNPTLSDTDGDGLSDKRELIDGFRIVIPGTSDSTIVYTSAIYEDTDLDKLNDGVEITIGTDPTNPDTDGDGRTDGAEYGNGTTTKVSDPLEPDIAYRVVLRNITTHGCGDHANGEAGAQGSDSGDLMWFFTLNEPNSGITLLSDALDADALLPYETGAWLYDATGGTRGNDALDSDYTGNKRQCYVKAVNDGAYYLNFDKASEVFNLKQGESIRIRSMVSEADGFVTGDCGIAPNYIPTTVSANQLMMTFEKTYFYEDLASASSGITITDTDATTLSLDADTTCSAQYQLDIQIIR